MPPYSLRIVILNRADQLDKHEVVHFKFLEYLGVSQKILYVNHAAKINAP
jgi:hypothetical protein